MRHNLISKIINEVADLVYPPGLYCNCCGKITDPGRTYGLCNDCMRDMRWITGRACAKCGKALGETDPGAICHYCKSHEHFFDKGYACCEYGMHEKTLLYELKYASRGDIGVKLGEAAYDRMAAELGEEELRDAYDLVLPVPLYKERKMRRGFNQAELMAREFSERSGIACDDEILFRTRPTEAMKGLGPSERRANIQGAFSVNEEKSPVLAGARTLVIDDIFTTGATLDEIARVLKEAGASRVDTLVFAAGADYLIV